MSEPESLLEFPCEFPIKIMGRSEPGFADAVVEVVLRHAPDFDPATTEMRASSHGKYIGLTCTIRAESRPQLDALYTELSRHPLVKVVL
jgi:putative lipoic acid-binding regulatory protein